MACRKEGLEPGRDLRPSCVRMVCEAGSPLPLEGYDWLYEQFGPEVHVNVGSGGTTSAAGSCRAIPLRPGLPRARSPAACSAQTWTRSGRTGTRSSASSASS